MKRRGQPCILAVIFCCVLSAVNLHARDLDEVNEYIQNLTGGPDIVTGFDGYPEREYPFLFNSSAGFIYKDPPKGLYSVPVPAGTVAGSLSIESATSLLLRLSYYPINLLYDQINGLWIMPIVLLKAVAIDYPLVHSAVGLNHLYSGTAVRLVESGMHLSRIKLAAPFPYDPKGTGYGGAYGNRPRGVDHNLMIVAGGAEANAVLSNEMALRWVADRAFFPYEAMMYIDAKTDAFFYIQLSTSSPSGFRTRNGGDFEQYVMQLNNKFGLPWPSFYRFTVSKLKRWSWAVLADPLLYISLAGAFAYQPITGEQYMKSYMIPLGEDLEFMPSSRVAFTPNGPECYGDLFFRLKNRAVVQGYVRGGTTVFKKFWGFGGRMYRWPVGKKIDLGGGIDLYYQPEMMRSASTLFMEYLLLYYLYPLVDIGTSISYLAILDIGNGYLAGKLRQQPGAALYGDFSYRPLPYLKLYGRIGYKTDGYVFGLALERGVFWHLGFGFVF